MSARAWRIIVMVVGAWFALQVITVWLLPLGGTVTDLALRLRPLDGESRLEVGREGLSRPEKEWTLEQMRSVMDYLDAAVRRNPLDYRAQFLRAHVLLRLEAMGEDTTDSAAAAMRKTLWLRWKNPEVGIEAMRFALSRWQFLTPEEQGFYREMFVRVVQVEVMRKGNFNRILEIWKRYSKDMQFLEAGLAQRPELYGQAAQALMDIQFNLDERQRYLALYESWAVGHFQQLLQNRIREERDNYDTWKKISEDLSMAVSGYFRLVPEVSFNYIEYLGLMDGLQMRMVTALTGTMEWARRPSSRKEIMKLATAMVERPAAKATLKELARHLERMRFFAMNERDLAVLEMRMRLLLRAGEANAAALIGGEVVKERHYVPPDETAAVQRIFILYAGALERLEKGDEALRVIDTARERAGSHASLDWMAFRLLNLSEKNSVSAAWQELSPEIRDSFRVLLDKKRVIRTVFPPPGNELVVRVTGESAAVLSGAKLVQVWVEGKILAERYAKDLEQGEEWRIKLFEEMWKRPVEVEVRIQ